jgi:exosortase C (VPDSG-CTERM-specific)
MKDLTKVNAEAAVAARPVGLPDGARRWLFFLGVLCLCFARPLYDLVRFAFHSELYSHLLLIPFISVYLARQEKSCAVGGGLPALVPAVLAGVAGLAVMAWYWVQRHAGWKPKAEDYLAFMMLAFWFLLLAGSFVALGARGAWFWRWPLGFLLFMVPMPAPALEGVETFLQRTSAMTASGLLELSGMPVFREGNILRLPGFSMQVAPECSGVHSTLVLLITSVLAGRLFLNRWWTRCLFVFAVVPLGIIRNGLRVWSLGELCVNLDPSWIDSAYHHRGGPIWFGLSLVPLFALLFWLRRTEGGWGNRTKEVERNPIE